MGHIKYESSAPLKTRNQDADLSAKTSFIRVNVDIIAFYSGKGSRSKRHAESHFLDFWHRTTFKSFALKKFALKTFET